MSCPALTGAVWRAIAFDEREEPRMRMSAGLHHAVLGGFFLFLSCNAFAGEHDGEITRIVAKAVEGWTPALTCSVLNDDIAQDIRTFWSKERSDITRILIKAAVEPDLIAEIARTTDPRAMMQKTEGSAVDLISYCKQNSNWMRDAQLMKIPLPSLEIKKFMAN
jgi:hypothetical protein